MPEPNSLQACTLRAGAVMTEQAGWSVPAHFGDPAAEYESARRQAAVFDVSSRSKVTLTGSEAAKFLHNLCTNDVLKLAPGSGCEAFLLNIKARVVAHGFVWHVAEPAGQASLWLDAVAGLADKIVKHLDHFLISEQVEFADRTRDLAQIHVAGPAAPPLLARVFGERVAELLPLRQACLEAGGGFAQFRRCDALGVPGYDLLCAPEAACRLWDDLLHAGARAAGMEAYEPLRIEAGTPHYGRDMDESHLAPEAGRTKEAISYAKGCYLGQEPVVRIRDLGQLNRTLSGLLIDARQALPGGARLLRDGAAAGHITSSAFSPRYQQVVALGYVRRGSHEPGTVLQAETAAGFDRAEVTSLPFAAPPSPAA